MPISDWRNAKQGNERNDRFVEGETMGTMGSTYKVITVLSEQTFTVIQSPWSLFSPYCLSLDTLFFNRLPMKCVLLVSPGHIQSSLAYVYSSPQLFLMWHSGAPYLIFFFPSLCSLLIYTTSHIALSIF